LRITATDTFTVDHEPIVTALRGNEASLHGDGTRFLLHGQPGNDNNRVIAMFQQPLAAVIGQTAAANQLDLIQEWVLRWAKVMLINNSTVAAELAKG
jgi:hypothetical protein